MGTTINFFGAFLMTNHISRRSIAKGAAWSIPAVAVASATPALAASGDDWDYATGTEVYYHTTYLSTDGDLTCDAGGQNSTTVFTIDNSSTSPRPAKSVWFQTTKGNDTTLAVAGMTYTITLPAPGLTFTVSNTGTGGGAWSQQGTSTPAGNVDGIAMYEYTFVYSAPVSVTTNASQPIPGPFDFKAVSNAADYCASGLPTYTSTFNYSFTADGEAYSAPASFPVDGSAE